MSGPVRKVRPDERDRTAAIYAVWELTLRCDHACSHCGSRAGRARPEELTPEKALEICAQIAALGIREVTLIGGEAYLRPDCADIIADLHARGVRVTMQTGGRGFTPEVAHRLKAAGLAAVGVSIDGLEAEHDLVRNARGSWQATMRALDAAREARLIATVNSQVNQWTLNGLDGLRQVLRGKGVRAWRCQLTVPMGRAADRPEWILQPWQILDLIDRLAAMQHEEIAIAKAAGLPPSKALRVQLGNNLGYYGPHEVTLRSRPGAEASWWTGCKAGQHTLGIESDGMVKACPSLPTAPYIGGNLMDMTLQQLWTESPEIAFTRERTVDELWGFCKTCDYAETCMAGCSFTAHCTRGRRGNMPFCYHRASTLKKQGRRERLVKVQAAAGQSYDFGRFEIVEEDWVD